MAACAASVVLETVVPTRVNNFRAVIASQVQERVKGTRLDWVVVKIFLLGLGDDEGDDVVEGLGDVVEDLGDEEVGEDFTERHICEWPGCPTETKDQVAMSTHLRQIHDRVKWVCPVRICRRRFVTEEEVIRHV